jgi:hypothetical protein
VLEPRPSGGVEPGPPASAITLPAETSASTPSALEAFLVAPRGLESEPTSAHWLDVAPPDEDDARIDAEGYYRAIYGDFDLSLGVAAFTKFNTNLQVNSDVGVGAQLDMEDLLGLDDEDVVARLDGNYAFNRRHWLAFSYYDIKRNGTQEIADDIQVGDTVIPAGEVDTGFETEIIKLAYRYNFVTDPRTVIGASFGIHLMRIDTALQSNDFDVEESFKVDAPLPLIGLHGAYALSEKWSLNASAEFLQFDIGAYRGLITDTRLTLNHDTFEHFGWGVGFNGFNVDATVEGDDDLTADLEYGYQGVMLYLRLIF